MDKKRQGEIALLYLKNKLDNDGVILSSNMKREIANTAKSIGISLEEAMEFVEILVREMVEKTFPKK
jgi:type III secretion system FlhB-like substrate exporter